MNIAIIFRSFKSRRRYPHSFGRDFHLDSEICREFLKYYSASFRSMELSFYRYSPIVQYAQTFPVTEAERLASNECIQRLMGMQVLYVRYNSHTQRFLLHNLVYVKLCAIFLTELSQIFQQSFPAKVPSY